MTLAILRERGADEFVVRLVGKFDARMADTVTQAILSAPELSVVVDLSELVSLDEVGLQALVDLSHQFAREGSTLRVVGARGDVQRYVQSSGLSGSDNH